MTAQHSPNTDEALLLQRLSRGDSAAFRTLVGLHLPAVLRTAERMLGDYAQAEDVAQDAMVRLWKKAQEWDASGPACIDTWLYRITVNLCIDRTRQRKHLPLEDIDLIISQEKSADAQVHQKQIETIIATLFDGLSRQQRLVIVLSYYEGLSAPQIAEILETTSGAVTALLHRGRNALRSKLMEMGIESWAHDKHQ